MSHVTRKSLSLGLQTRSDTNRTVHPQKMLRGLRFCMQNEEGFHYMFTENKGADQLCGDDLCLCFRICEKAFFLLKRLK